jgi:hypothetical protein
LTKKFAYSTCIFYLHFRAIAHLFPLKNNGLYYTTAKKKWFTSNVDTIAQRPFVFVKMNIIRIYVLLCSCARAKMDSS